MVAATENILTFNSVIVGTATNTTVWIMPSSTAHLAGHSGAYSTNLNQGQTYQINSSDYTGDVTGTTVTSTKPVAVFSGANDAYVPDGGYYAGNPLMQEQLPVEQWGTNVVALSFAGRLNGDAYRVLAYTNTTVTITNSLGISIVTNLTAGTFCETNLDGQVWFQANKPIQVAQFANGSSFSGEPGDPCEILLPPTGHWLNSYTVYVAADDPNLTMGDFDENYLNLIVSQSGISSTLTNGIPVPATNFVAVGSSGYYGAQIPVTNGVYTVNSSQPVEVQVYGWGIYDAYGYFGGTVIFP
jgi:IgGFc binding protein